MAAKAGARPGSSAPDSAIAHPAKTAGPAGLGNRRLLSAGDPGGRRYLWLAANGGRPHPLLDRGRDWPRCVGRAPDDSGETPVPPRDRGEQSTGGNHGGGEQRFPEHLRRALVHDGDVRGARCDDRPGERGGGGTSTVARGAHRRAHGIHSFLRPAAWIAGTLGVYRDERGPRTGRCIFSLHRWHLRVGPRRDSAAFLEPVGGNAATAGGKRTGVTRSRPRPGRDQRQRESPARRCGRDRGPAVTLTRGEIFRIDKFIIALSRVKD